jgi:hypothetical protein
MKAALHRCAGCKLVNRPDGYVLCRACWRSKVPQALKTAFNQTRGYEAKAEAARGIIRFVTTQAV